MQPFQFKQFAVAHSRSTMQVGTDAVLLGAWAKQDKPNSILDVGTGCGIIALMLAQRYTAAAVEAIDYDATSVVEASENFANSPFAERLSAKQADFRDVEGNTKYDLIVSNPPYFNDKIKPTDESRRLARNTETLPYPALVKGVTKLLATTGGFCCVLPTNVVKEFILEAELVGLKANEIRYIKYNNTAEISIALMRFSFIDVPLVLDTLLLFDGQQPTAAYHQLVKDFYLWG